MTLESAIKHAEQVACGFTPEELLQRLLKARELRGKMINFLYDEYPAIDEIGWGLDSELLLYILLIKHNLKHLSQLCDCQQVLLLHLGYSSMLLLS